MSALADSRAQAGSRPPAYLPLLLATLPAQILTGLALWVVQLPLALLGVTPTSVANSLWLPWGLAGAWAALGLAAYVLIVCALGGALFAGRVERRGIARPAAAWSGLAFGAAGYGALALGHDGNWRLLLAVVLAPLTLRLFAYRADGTLRPWRPAVSLGGRMRVPALVAAGLLALSYSACHAFGQDGTAGSASRAAGSGHSVVLSVGLQGIALPSRVTAVQLNGPGASSLRVIWAALTSEQGTPRAGAAGVELRGPVARSLPVALPGEANAWLAVRFTLLGCPRHRPQVDAVTLHYRVLGIATSERVSLWRAVEIACRPAAAGASLSD